MDPVSAQKENKSKQFELILINLMFNLNYLILHSLLI